MNTFSHVPPGFRFHPTDEELVDYYLRRKVTSRRIDLDVIKDVDLYKIEPWDLQDLCSLGTEEQNEWFFFSHKDKKYPTGTRTNRATTAGFWKATGRDKAIYSKNDLIGMRKTLVFYKGRAPNGQKSDYIMHEYRLETDENGSAQEEGWAVCKVFKKKIATIRKLGELDSPVWYDDQVSFMPDMDSPKQQQPNYPNILPYHYPYNTTTTSCKKEIDHLQYGIIPPDHHFHQLPLLESPKMIPNHTNMNCNTINSFVMNPGNNSSEQQMHQTVLDHQSFSSVMFRNNNVEKAGDQVTDWRVLDKFVASQLSHAEVNKENETFVESNLIESGGGQEMAAENNGSISSSIDLWK